MRSKISISSLERSLDYKHGGRRYNIRVFTEQGVAMLATILKSKIAVEVSIRIMDAFVLMKHYILDNKDINLEIILITSNKSKLEDGIIEKFNRQYDKLKVVKNNKLHDRYLIMDRKNVYHIGTSLNHIGEKMFSINKNS